MREKRRGEERGGAGVGVSIMCRQFELDVHGCMTMQKIIQAPPVMWCISCEIPHVNVYTGTVSHISVLVQRWYE